MMQPNLFQRSADDVASLGTAIFDLHIKSKLGPEDTGKFVAIDITSREYELDQNDYAAVARLRARIPTADIWLMRVGSPATCRLGAYR